MNIRIFDSKQELGEAAASDSAAIVRDAISARGRAVIIAATGASQFEFLDALTRAPGIDWARVTGFHLDEYIGLPATHPASFRGYLQERLVSRVRPGAFHYIDGEAPDPFEECRRVGALVAAEQVDVACVGIGENGHLAFNDPPADFDTTQPYLVVDLDERCRRQQLGEGWFPTLGDVPRRAISMSIREILRARHITCVVPDARKAEAVATCVDGAVSPMHPASALQLHDEVTLYLDRDSASRLRRR
jgi:glucosamine-6-phosphate deaminase